MMPKYRLNVHVFIAIVTVSVIAFSGCTPSEPATVVEEQAVTVEVGDIAAVVDGGIELQRANTGRVAFIAIPNTESVREVVFHHDSTQIAWVSMHPATKEKDQYYTIQVAHVDSREPETVYLSKKEPYGLSFAHVGGYIGFVEEDILYSLQPNTGAVFALRSDIDRAMYAWSPAFAAVLVRTTQDTAYVEVDAGQPVASVRVFDQPLDGLAFIDSQTVVGVAQQEQVASLHTVDLRTIESTLHYDWEYSYSFLQSESEEDAQETEVDADEAETELESDEEATIDPVAVQMHRFTTKVLDSQRIAIGEYVLVGDSKPAVYYYDGLFTDSAEYRQPFNQPGYLRGWSGLESVFVESVGGAVSVMTIGESEPELLHTVDAAFDISVFKAEE